MTYLDDIGLRTGTDKSSRHHNYLNYYESRLSYLVDKEFLMFEYGVFDGASIRMWSEYFPRARIVGLDYDEKPTEGYADNVAIRRGDATDPRTVKNLLDEFGAPLLVLDDASHRWDHQIASLQITLPHITSGGIMIIEDLHTNFTAMGSQYTGHADLRATDYLLEMAKFVTARGNFNGTARPIDFFVAQQGLDIESMEFSGHVCLIKKKA